MNQKDLLSFEGGLKREEMHVVASPTGRMKHRLLANLPKKDGVFGVSVLELDFSKLEEHVNASVASQGVIILEDQD